MPWRQRPFHTILIIPLASSHFSGMQPERPALGCAAQYNTRDSTANLN